MYVECSSMFTEKSLPGTNVAAKTQLVRNDSHQNWRSSKLFQLIEVSVCVFFLFFFDESLSILSSLPHCFRPPTIIHSHADLQTHSFFAFINSKAGRGCHPGNGVSLWPQEVNGQRQRKQGDGERWREFTFMHSMKWRMEDEGNWANCLVGFPLLPSTAAPRRSTFPPLFLCGPELRVIPKQSALIQGLRGLEHSAAREPSPWPVLTHATLDTLYTRWRTNRVMQPLIGHDGVFYCSLEYGPRQRAPSHTPSCQTCLFQINKCSSVSGGF